MPTSKAKSVTIELTAKQQEKLRKLTGHDHSEIRVEVTKGRTARKPLSAKAAPRGSVFDTGEYGRGGGTTGGLPIA